MKRFLIVLMSLSFVFNSNAQLIKFIKSYGNTGYDYGRDIKEDNDTGYVVTGSSSSFTSSNADAYLMKVDSLGNFMWSYNYGGPGVEWGESLVITSDSTYAFAGYTNSYGAGGFDFYLVRTDSAGIPLWYQTYGGTDWDKAYGLVQLPDDGFVLVGDTYSYGNGERNGYIVRTDASGDTIWTKVISGPEEDFLYDVALDGDSLIIVGGTSSYGNGMLDGYILKMHIDGTIGTEKYVGQAYNDYFTSVVSVGGFYAFGGIRGYQYPTEKDNMWMYKTQADLTLEFDITYSGLSVENDGVNDIGINPFNQDMYYVGYTSSWGYLLDGLPDIFMGKLSSAPAYITQKNYGEKGNDIGQALDACKDYGAVFLCDSKYFATGGNNILIIKLNYQWTYPGQIIHMEWDDITTNIEDNLDKNFNSLVYPNPVQNELSISGENVIGSFSIFSSDGQLIVSGEIQNNKVDLSGLDHGIYIIRIETEKSVISKRIIKS